MSCADWQTSGTGSGSQRPTEGPVSVAESVDPASAAETPSDEPPPVGELVESAQPVAESLAVDPTLPDPEVASEVGLSDEAFGPAVVAPGDELPDESDEPVSPPHSSPGLQAHAHAQASVHAGRHAVSRWFRRWVSASALDPITLALRSAPSMKLQDKRTRQEGHGIDHGFEEHAGFHIVGARNGHDRARELA